MANNLEQLRKNFEHRYLLLTIEYGDHQKDDDDNWTYSLPQLNGFMQKCQDLYVDTFNQYALIHCGNDVDSVMQQFQKDYEEYQWMCPFDPFSRMNA